MKTWKRALALVLALVMALSLVALPSFAAGEETGGGDTGMPYIKDQGGTVTKDGLVMSKTIKKGENGQFLLTLEAYATGSTTTTSTKPVDIVLVLDVSGSMKENLTEAGYRYNEVYDLSTNGTYYYKNSSNGQYQRAYYCDGENWSGNSNHDAGWYTRNHQSLGNCRGESGTRLIPKTSSADTTGTQFYVQEYVAAVTKMNALKSAVKGFVNSVSAKSPESNIAIVKFGAEINNEIGNDFNGSGSNYTQTVKGLTPASSSAELNAAVDALQYGGYTPAHLGLQLAKGIIEKDPNTDRQKVLVLFTDGEPNGVDSISGFETSAANKAIANSKSIKAVGATVYTIGCFGTTPSDTSDTGKYMNYVSSNYPNATSMTSGGDKADPANYYKTVSSAADLNNIVTDISQTIGGTTVTLGRTSVLRDVISDSFTLPEGYKDGDIKAYSVDCTAVSNDGSTYTWSANHDTTPYSVTVEGKTINVTGFDYAANWVGKDTTTGEMHTPAKKLVVEIPIVPEQDATGSVKTNGDASGIYADSTVKDPVEKFPSPVVYIPYFTVVHVASTVNDQGHNEGKRTGETHHPVWCNRPFNLTSVVTENYLYGGTFNEEACTTVHDKVKGQNPMAIAPVENETYYIWEVPDTYLRPFAFWVSRHLEGGNGTQNVTQMYLLSLLDRVNYLDAGLYVQFAGDDKGEYISSGCEQLTGETGVNKATVYQMLQYALYTAPDDILETWYLVDGKVTTFDGKLQQNTDGKYLNGTNSVARVIDDGCIIGHRLDSGEFVKFQDHSVTYRPYWITQDGVRVEGLRDRTYSFVKDSEKPRKDGYNAYETKDAYEFVGTGTQAVQTLSLRTNMLTAESEPAVENVTVTVVDAAKTYELTVSAGTGIRDQVAYQAPAGKVFAGWFADQAYTTPADLDQVTQDTTIYAKYVSDSYLDLDYSRTGLFRLRGVTLISAVDNPANYQASGFIVGDQKVDVSYAGRYRIFKTPASLFGAARDAKLMLADKSLSGTGDLEVTPYWVTLDGTEVHGVTHTLHYNTRTIWE